MQMHETLIRQAFQQAYDNQSTNPRLAESICDYVRDFSNDRRYRLFFNATCTSFRTAIVTYRGVRYYVDHDYPSNTYKVSIS